MPSSQKVEQIKTSLKIDEDIALHQRGWKLQKIALFLILITVLLTALGLFGNGPLSSKRISSRGIVLDYEKFMRFEGQASLRFSFAQADSLTRISLPVSYLDYFKIETVVPEPVESSVQAGEIIYTFNASAGGGAVFSLSPVQVGGLDATIKVNGVPFQLTHFTYP